MLAILILLLTIAAMIMDIKTGKVDNRLIFISSGAALLFRLVRGGPAGMAAGFAGMAIPFVLLFLLFSLRMLGAGDIKLFCSLGAFLGPAAILKCIAVSFLIGALIALSLMLKKGIIIERFRYFFSYLSRLLTEKTAPPYRCGGLERPENFHFTIPIFISVIMMCALKEVPVF